MGKGGQRAVEVVKPTLAQPTDDGVWRSPYNPLDKDAPELPTKGEIRAVIPKECFERSYVKSVFYLLRDLAMAAALVYGTSQVLSTDVPSLDHDSGPLKILAWAAGWGFYAFWMGTILTGPWVLVRSDETRF